MMKKRILLLVLSLVCMLLSSTALQASTENHVTDTPTPRLDQDWGGNPMNAPRLAIEATSPIALGSSFILELSSNAEWSFEGYSDPSFATITSDTLKVTSSSSLTTSQAGYTMRLVTDRMAEVIIIDAEFEKDDMIYIPMIIKIDGGDEVTVSLSGVSGGFSDGQYIIANPGISTGKLSLSPSIEMKDENIILNMGLESTAAVSGTLKITLPEGYKWQSSEIIAKGSGGFNNNSLRSFKITSLSSGDNRVLSLVIDRALAQSGKIDFTNMIIKPPSDKSEGEITATFSGLGLSKDQKVKLGSYKTTKDETEQPEQPEQPIEPEKVEKTIISFIIGSNNTFIDPVTESTLIPLRWASNGFGINDDQIEWDGVTKTATIRTDTKTAEFKSMDNNIIINGTAYPMECYARIIDNRIYVPYRITAEMLFDAVVTFDTDTKTVTMERSN